MKQILDAIDSPAALEQAAEECAELAHACLKYARALRGENPTPKTEPECIAAINEELADLALCINVLDADGIIDEDAIERTMDEKEKRWKERLKEGGKI